MNKAELDLLLQYIDAAINDAIFNHKVSEHGGCYYAYSNDAADVRKKLEKLVGGK